MKAIMSACGRFYSVNDWGTFADTDEGVIYSDNYENIEFYLNQAKEDFPQYDWKIVTFELKDYEKAIVDEIPELNYYRDIISYNKSFNDTFTGIVGKNFKFKEGELLITSFNPLPTSVGGIMHRNELSPFDQELYNFQGVFTCKDGAIVPKCFNLDYLLEELPNKKILEIIKKS